MERKIKFTSIISDGTDELDHSFIAYGQVSVNEEGMLHKLVFPEPLEDGLTLETMITLTDNRLSIVREGVVSMMQNFILGEEVVGTYETEYGVLDTSVYTVVLEYSGDINSGDIYLVYDLYVDRVYTQQIRLSVEYD